MTRTSAGFNFAAVADYVSALLLIDLQAGFGDARWGRRNNPGAEVRAARLADFWRAAGLPVVHVHHRSRAQAGAFWPGSPGALPLAATAPEPGEDIVEKTVHCAFIGTDLAARLRRCNAGSLVLAGLTTDHCVSTTARVASDLGFTTTVVSDATATFDRVAEGRRWRAELLHGAALASLADEFAAVIDTDAALAGAACGVGR